MDVTQLERAAAIDGAAAGAAEDPLRRASREFEGLFIAQMFAAMRRTVPESGLLGDSSGQKMFRDMLDVEMARHVALSGGFGIGEAIYRQLSPAGLETSVEPSQKGEQIDENR